jgi:hypothetical protein
MTTVAEDQALVDRWRWKYNTLMPHLGRQGRTPLAAAQEAVHYNTLSLHLDK